MGSATRYTLRRNTARIMKMTWLCVLHNLGVLGLTSRRTVLVIYDEMDFMQWAKILIFLGVNESPLMTWGQIDSTPLRLEPTATPGPAFRFPEESERERLTHKMVDANTKRHRCSALDVFRSGKFDF